MHRHSSTCRRTKDGRHSFSCLDYPWNSFVCHYICFQWGNFLPTNLLLTSPIGPFVQRCGARQYLAHAFSELNQKNSPNACKSLANARTFSTWDFAASCDTTCKSHFMCASGDGKRSKHAKNKLKKPCIVGVNAKVKVQLTTSKLSWTYKFPQSEMFLPCTEIKKQTELWFCQFFYRVSVYNPSGFLCRIALVWQYCCDIVQSSLANHQNHSFNGRINCKLLSTTGSLGITNTCTKPAPYIIICYYRSCQGSTMLAGPEVLQCQCFILEPSVFIPRGGAL